MIKKYSDKKKVYISLILIFLLMTLIGGTYAIITKTITSSKKQVITAGVLSLSLDEEEEINITDAYPMYDEVGMIQEPFTFSLTNTGGDAVDYTLVMEEIIVEQTEHKCSSLGEITIDSPEECRKIDYSSELRQEALTMCQAWFSDIVTENDCLVAMKNDGAPYTKFEDFIEEGIYYGQFEDKRVVTETYPDNYILYEFPKISKYNVKYGITKDGISNIDYASNTNVSGKLVIDAGIIEQGQTIDYELRLWIADFVEDIEEINGKSLKFRIAVDAAQTEKTLDQSSFNYVISNYIVKNYHACAEYLVEKGISTDYDTAILTDCQSITEGYKGIQNTYPTEFQEMVTNGIVKEEYGATITGYDKSSSDILIPNTVVVPGYSLGRGDIEEIAVPVVAIGAYGIEYFDSSQMNSDKKNFSVMPLAAGNVLVSKIVIPDSVLYVGTNAFGFLSTYYFKNSANLQVAGPYSFSFVLTKENQNMSLPNTLTYAGEYSFANNSLKNIILPESLIKIKEGSFYNNELAAVIIPKNVTEISERAFEDNYELTKIINKTGKAFDWYNICFWIENQQSFVTGTLSSEGYNSNVQTIEVVSE